MKVDLPWLSFEKPTAINLDDLQIRVPYGTETQYTLSLNNLTVKSDSLRDGLIKLLFDAEVVNLIDPHKILREIEKMSGEQGKKLIRSALEETMPVKEVKENYAEIKD